MRGHGREGEEGEREWEWLSDGREGRGRGGDGAGMRAWGGKQGCAERGRVGNGGGGEEKADVVECGGG